MSKSLLELSVVLAISAILLMASYRWLADLLSQNASLSRTWQANYQALALNRLLMQDTLGSGIAYCGNWQSYYWHKNDLPDNIRLFYPVTQPVSLITASSPTWQDYAWIKKGNGQWQSQQNALLVVDHVSLPLLTAPNHGRDIAVLPASLTVKAGDVVAFDDCMHLWLTTVASVSRGHLQIVLHLATHSPYHFLRPAWISLLSGKVLYLGKDAKQKLPALYLLSDQQRRYQLLPNLQVLRFQWDALARIDRLLAVSLQFKDQSKVQESWYAIHEIYAS